MSMGEEIKNQLTENVYDYLVNKILVGELKPGDKISEAALSKEFQISRTPVREAMQILVESGILERRPKCATSVAIWSNEKILKLEVVRTDLENLAAKLALIYGSNNDFHKMHIHSKACYEAGLNNDICTLLKEDQAFHMEIARISGNELLHKILDDVHKQICFLLCWKREFLHPAQRQYEWHEEIIQAFIDRNEQQVITLLTKHNRHSFNVNKQHYFTSDFFLRGYISEL